MLNYPYRERVSDTRLQIKIKVSLPLRIAFSRAELHDAFRKPIDRPPFSFLQLFLTAATLRFFRSCVLYLPFGRETHRLYILPRVRRVHSAETFERYKRSRIFVLLQLFLSSLVPANVIV